MAIRREIDSPYAWFRLAMSILLSATGAVGMWSGIVTLPAMQAEFHVDRAAASLPFTLLMIGFGAGGVMMGRIADRKGVLVPICIGAVSLATGFILASLSTGLAMFATGYVIIGTLGVASTWVPLLANVSFWFERRRGIAVALCASGNSLAGAVWPNIVEWGIQHYGWRATHAGLGIFCLLVLPPLAFLLRGRPPAPAMTASSSHAAAMRRVSLSPRTLQILLSIAGVACCVAMSMPQVHIVAYCSDLGYGAERGAQMLSLMLGFSIVSRICSGFLADRLGGLSTLLLGSFAQAVALVMFMLMHGLASLYFISALFGLFQGGLVPSYAIIVRENYPASEAGWRVGVVMMMTMIGMALGGWLSGVIYDWTGSYQAAFANGVGWNVLNFAIAVFLMLRSPIISPRSAIGRRAESVAG